MKIANFDERLSGKLKSKIEEVEVNEVHLSAPRTDLRLRYFCFAVLVTVLVIFSAIRIRLRTAPLERDEGEYAYAGQLMLDGDPPYHSAYNMKLPGTDAAYALMMAVFGETTTGIRIGMLVVLIGNTLMVFFLGQRLFGILAGTVAAAFYTILANRLQTMSLDGHATHFIVLTALAATLLLLRAIERKNTIALFGSGLLFGLAFLMKQHGILFAVFGFLFWAWTTWKLRETWHRTISEGIALASGILLPYLVTCFIALVTGVFKQFWFWTVAYGSAYEKILPFSDGWRLFKVALPWFPRPLNIWILAVFGLVAVFFNRRAREKKVFVLGFVFFSVLAVFPGLYFRPHYFLVMYPAVALMAGLAISSAYEYLQKKHTPRLAWAAVAFFVLVYASGLYGQKKFLFKMDPLHVHREMHRRHGFAEAKVVADYIHDRSSSQDRIAIIGSEPEIYFYSHRRSATGYIYMYSLMEDQKFTLQMQHDMIREVEIANPKFVVFADNQLSWGWGPPWNATEPRMNIFAWARHFVDTKYSLVAEVPIHEAPDCLWGAPCRFYIFQRN